MEVTMLGSLQRNNLFLRFIYPVEVPHTSVCLWDVVINALFSPLKWLYVAVATVAVTFWQLGPRALWIIVFHENHFPEFTKTNGWRPEYRERLANKLLSWKVEPNYREFVSISGIPLIQGAVWGLVVYAVFYVLTLGLLSELASPAYATSFVTGGWSSGSLLPAFNWNLFWIIPAIWVFGFFYGNDVTCTRLSALLTRLCPMIEMKR